MAGIELYAPRRPRHRRTWTAAALVLAIVFIALGQTLAFVPGMLLGLMTPDGADVGWLGTAWTLAGFAFIRREKIVLGAVSLDLFNPDRMAPVARYRLPSDPAAVASDTPPPARPVVLGTAIASDGSSFATCQLESSRLLMVRVGDKVGVYLVKAIERGRVVFQTPAGERLEIQALRPGS